MASMIDTLKITLGSTSPDTILRVQFGTDGTVVQITADELARAVGVTAGAKANAAASVPPSAAASASKKVKVTSDFLRIRAKPTTSAAEVAQYKKDEVFEILNETPVTADNYTWYKTADGRGFIAVEFTTPVDGFAPVPPSAGSFPAVPPSAGSFPAAANVATSGTAMPITPTGNWTFPFTATMRGVGGSAGGWAPDNNQLDLVKRNNIEVVFICCYEGGQAAKAIPAFRSVGVKHFVLRAAIHEPITSADRFVQLTTPLLKEYVDILGSKDVMIQIHNEVNLVQEGWTKAWRDGGEFANWFIAVANAYRNSFPGCKLGYPAMSPGSDVPNIRLAEPTFISQSMAAVHASDWCAVHNYWAKPDGSDINPPADLWRQWFGTKPIIGTEVGPSDANTTSVNAVRIAYDKFAQCGVPAIAWILNGAGAWHNAAWDEHSIYL